MFWGKFRLPLAALDRCTLNKGAFAFKIVRGALKWPLKGGSRLIEVAAAAGLTVLFICVYILDVRLFLIFESNTFRSREDSTSVEVESMLDRQT